MRIYDDRYTRERLRFHVALRFIRLEARTQTIRRWTGLTDDRIRKLYRSYLTEGPRLLPRHRGKSPHRAALFLRSTRARRDSALLASLCRLLGALPERRGAEGALLPSLRRAQLLCQAYETYRGLVPDGLLSFEHAVFLLSTLAGGNELTCSHCRDCRALVVIDRWSLSPALCELCSSELLEARSARAAARRPLGPIGCTAPAATAGAASAAHARESVAA
jgi:hypothetical protein